MRKLFTLSFLSLFALAAGIAQANELVDPGFEDDPTVVWNSFASAGGVSQHSTLMPLTGTGNWDLQVVGANQFAGVYQDVAAPVNPGNKVVFSGWNKSLVEPFTGTAEVKLEWMGAPQFRVDHFAIGPDYEPFMIMGIAPPGTTGVRATYALSTFNAGAGNEHNVYLDDFNLEIIPEPACMMLGLIGTLGLAGLVLRRR